MALGISNLHRHDDREVGPFDLQFDAAGRRFAICLGAIQTGWASSKVPKPAIRWRLRSPEAGFQFFSPRRILVDADIRQLRAMLGRRCHFVHRLNDHDVRESVLQLLKCGTFELLELVDESLQINRGDKHLENSSSAPSSVVPTTFYSSDTKSQEHASLEVASSPEQNRQVVDFLQAVDQDAQAALLVAAAQCGAPVCEECVRRANSDLQPEIIPA